MLELTCRDRCDGWFLEETTRPVKRDEEALYATEQGFVVRTGLLQISLCGGVISLQRLDEYLSLGHGTTLDVALEDYARSGVRFANKIRGDGGLITRRNLPDPLKKPGSCVSPAVVGGSGVRCRGVRRRACCQASEVPESYQLGRLGISLPRAVPGPRREQADPPSRSGTAISSRSRSTHRLCHLVATPRPPGVLHQDSPHGLGPGGEEVPAAVPVADLLAIDQPHVRFMDQRRGLKCLAWLLVSHPWAASAPNSS